MGRMKPVISKCKRCGMDYERLSGPQIYCKPCSHELETARRNAVSKKSKFVVLNVKRHCVDCGDEFEPHSGTHIYCEVCGSMREKQNVKRGNERKKQNQVIDDDDNHRKRVHNAYASRQDRSPLFTVNAYKIVHDPDEYAPFKPGVAILTSEMEFMRANHSFTPGTILERKGERFIIFIDHNNNMKIRKHDENYERTAVSI